MATSRAAGSAEADPAATLGLAPAFAMDATYAAMADSIGLAMANAVAHQQNQQAIGGAALTQALALILKKGSTQ
jgi:hypothetical protein